jgi:hypothetical protein
MDSSGRTRSTSDPAGLAKTFRQQIIALGALWTVAGLANAGLAVASFAGLMSDKAAPAMDLIAPIFLAIGIVWIAVGVSTCMQIVPGLFVGLVLSYIFLVATVVQLQLCPAAILLLAVLQAHRVLGLRKQIRAAAS